MSRAIEIYRGLCGDLSKDELGALARHVRQHYLALLEAQRQSELVSIDLAEMLADRLEVLLAAASTMSSDQRQMIVGAARYFIADDDALPDAATLTGLDDDVEVFNHVATLLDREDLLITE